MGYKKRTNNDDREFNQQLIHLARVTRVMAGGKRMRFRATVVIGDGRGKVGYGVAKGADVPLSINKAAQQAKRTLVKVPIVNKTIPHQVRLKYKAAIVLLKPAPQGTGIKAGSVVRQVLEIAGVPNVVGKILGTRNKLVNAQAVIRALGSFKTEGLTLDKIEKPKEQKFERRPRRDNKRPQRKPVAQKNIVKPKDNKEKKTK